jgi:hypothetical protein
MMLVLRERIGGDAATIINLPEHPQDNRKHSRYHPHPAPSLPHLKGGGFGVKKGKYISLMAWHDYCIMFYKN